MEKYNKFKFRFDTCFLKKQKRMERVKNGK